MNDDVFVTPFMVGRMLKYPEYRRTAERCQEIEGQNPTRFTFEFKDDNYEHPTWDFVDVTRHQNGSITIA